MSFPVEQPVRLMFQDEARFGRISRGRYCWMRKPSHPMVKASLTHQYTYAYGAVSPMDGLFISLMLPQVNTDCMQVFINEVSVRCPRENIIMVIDGAGWHRSNELSLPDNIRFLPLPPYSPELNPQEHIWDELREKFFHNHAFESLDALEDRLVEGLVYLEENPDKVSSITKWPWIFNACSNAN